MGFVSYPHLILLISGQMFEVTVVHEIFLGTKRALGYSPFICNCKENYVPSCVQWFWFSANNSCRPDWEILPTIRSSCNRGDR